ncbi:MAG: polysaccharide biosynthesis/export family protein [Cyclobacteriaceae bacterium]
MTIKNTSRLILPAIIFSFFLLLFSCVSNKKIQYLQSDEDNSGRRSSIPVDTVLKKYDLIPFTYKLQHEDALSVKISSLTPEEYDFFSLGALQGGNMMGGGQMMMGGALQGYLIDVDGNIEFPVVGKVKVSGLTIYEVEKKIQDIAREYLEEPMVRVRLLNFRFTVLGEVNGERTLATFNNRVSVPEAISLAGGIAEMGDRSRIKIIRQHGDVASVHYINLLSEDFFNSPYYYVNQNDIIIVPPLKQRSFRRYWAQNVSIVVSTLSLLILLLNLTN